MANRQTVRQRREDRKVAKEEGKALIEARSKKNVELMAQIQEVQNWIGFKLITLFNEMSREDKNDLIDNEYKWFCAKLGGPVKLTDLFMMEFGWLRDIRIEPVPDDDKTTLMYKDVKYFIGDKEVVLHEMEAHIRDFVPPSKADNYQVI